MAIVVAGSRYFYNNTSGAVYPWSPDLEKISGLLLFVPSTSGTFDVSMTLVGYANIVDPVKAAADAADAARAAQDAAEAAAQAATQAVVPTASGPSSIPAVNLTHSDFNQE